MKSALRNFVLLLGLLITSQAIAQDNYKGDFRGKTPIGEHIQYDEKTKAEIIVNYSNSGFIQNVRIESSNRDFSFPSKIDSIKWSLIKPGLWINTIDPEEEFDQSFPKKTTINCHYAGYLLDGLAFDNSFVRAKSLEAQLKQMISGFSLGIWNVPVGEVRVIRIAPKLAYKDKRAGSIPPNSSLIFFIYRIE
ncbi:MAG: FKBP-type peptidyl-prolyl cis-trans isomerase [Bacteroidia bacterium]